MRLYIATPINSRKEKTFREKYLAAKHRFEMLKELVCFDPRFDAFAEIVSTFSVNPYGMYTEEEALGRCVTAILGCDAIYLDHGWRGSKGCNLEYRVAKIYGKEILGYDSM